MTENTNTNEAETPEEAPPVLPLDFWDVQLRMISKLFEEADREYTSKNRLRVIAKMALAQLLALCSTAQKNEQAQQQEAAEATEAPESRIITLNDGERIVTP